MVGLKRCLVKSQIAQKVQGFRVLSEEIITKYGATPFNLSPVCHSGVPQGPVTKLAQAADGSDLLRVEARDYPCEGATPRRWQA